MESQNRKDRVEDWIQDVLRYRIEDKDKKRVLARCADIEAYGQAQPKISTQYSVSGR